MLLFADEVAQQTANASLIVSLGTVVVLPLVTMLITKWAEARKQNSELGAAKAKIDSDAMLAKAKIDTEAMLAKAKIDLDSKLSLLAAQHDECVTKNQAIETKLDECERQHFISSAEREKLKEESEENRRRIEKFEDFMEKHEARRQAAVENL